MKPQFTHSPAHKKINQVNYSSLYHFNNEQQHSNYLKPSAESKTPKSPSKNYPLKKLTLPQKSLPSNTFKKPISASSRYSQASFMPSSQKGKQQSISHLPQPQYFSGLQEQTSTATTTKNSSPQIKHGSSFSSFQNMNMTGIGQFFEKDTKSIEAKTREYISICTQKIKEEPSNLKIYEKRLKQYIQIAEFDKAIADAEFILKQEPKNIFALYQRGTAYMKKKNIELATADFDRIISIDPDHTGAALMKASCLNLKGEYGKAFDQYKDALDKDNEKNQINNQSFNFNIKRSFQIYGTSQGSGYYYDQMEQEELQMGIDSKNSLSNTITSTTQLSIKKAKKENSQAKPEVQQRSNSYKLQMQNKFYQNGAKSKSISVLPNQTSVKSKENSILTQEKSNQTSEQARNLFNSGYLARQKEDYQKAIEMYSMAISLQPTFLKAIFNRGFLYDKIGEYEKACQDYSRVIQIDNKFAFAYFNRGISFDKFNDQERAVIDFTEAINIDSTNSDFYLNRGNSLQKLEQHYEAIQDYSKCIDFQSPKLSSIYLSRALSFEKCGDKDRAKNDYQKSLDLGTPQIYVCCSRLGNIYQSEDNYKQALIFYNRALDSNASSIYCLAKRAQLFTKLQNYQLAIEDLNKAIKLNDQMPSLFFYRAKAFNHLPKHSEALEDLLKALSFKPEDQNILRLLSHTLVELGKYEQAIENISKEIKYHGESEQTLYNRSFCFRKLSRFKEAEIDLRNLISKDPSNLKLQKSLAICLYNQKIFEEARDIFNLIINSSDDKDCADIRSYRDECIVHIRSQNKNQKEVGASTKNTITTTNKISQAAYLNKQ